MPQPFKTPSSTTVVDRYKGTLYENPKMSQIPEHILAQMINVLKAAMIPAKSSDACTKFNLNVSNISLNNKGVIRIRFWDSSDGSRRGKEYVRTAKSIAHYIEFGHWLPSTIVIHSLCSDPNCCNPSHWDIDTQGGDTNRLSLNTSQETEKKPKKKSKTQFRLKI